jgi:hydroxymethylglutaryl-CoA lyase
MNRRNIGMGLPAAVDTSVQTLQQARAAGLATRAYVAVAFECPFEGRTPPGRVEELAQRMAEAGADEIVIADSIGAAGPAQVRELLALMLGSLPAERLGLHFHDTRGMALANSLAALELGLRRFDASVGGLGGCPFAPGASGNLATEDLVLMAAQSGLSTGFDQTALLEAVGLAEELVGYPIGGRSARWHRSRAAAAQREETH